MTGRAPEAAGGVAGPEGPAPRFAQRPPNTPWVRVVLTGLLAGLTAGLFGVGGGSVIVPGLVLLAGFPHKLATGTSLGAIIPTAAVGALSYAAGGELDWPVVAWTSLGAILGAVAGTYLLARLRTRWLQLAFAALMVVTALRMFTGEADGSGRSALNVAMALGLILLGMAAGLTAGLLGVGGGVVLVPLLAIAFGMPHVMAKGTSLAIIVPTAVAGTALNRRAGLTALGPAVAVGAGGVVAATAGSQIALVLDPHIAQALFGLLMVTTAIHLSRQALRRGTSTFVVD